VSTSLREVIVASPSGAVLDVDAGDLVALASARWGAHAVTSHASDLPNTAVTIRVTPDDEPGFQIDVAADGQSVSADGTPEQNAEVALLVSRALPAERPRVIAFDQGWTVHVDLTAGMTLDELRSRLVDHSVPGWGADDPDFQ